MKQRKKLAKVTISFLLAVLLALQGTGPIFVQAKEIVQDASQAKEFARPEALTEEEAGINESSSENQQKGSIFPLSQLRFAAFFRQRQHR